MDDVLQAVLVATAGGEAVALATVVETRGPSPAKAGFKAAIWPDGRWLGNVGGGALEQRIRADAQQALTEGRSRLAHYALRPDGPDAVGMVCGGDVTVFIEVYAPPPRLLIVGGGNVGQPLAQMARLVGFGVDLMDPDPQRATGDAPPPEEVTPSTFIVLVTEDHRSDLQALRRYLPTPAAYIGMIGSRHKVGAVFGQLAQEGVSEGDLARVRAPIGLDLGGSSPAEIALSILSEIVQVRYGATGQPLSRLQPCPELARNMKPQKQHPEELAP